MGVLHEKRESRPRLIDQGRALETGKAVTGRGGDR